MANGDGDQSKRPPLSQHDSDSQVSDKGQHGGQHHRHKKAAHHVGGRLHARNPSIKNLHKGHGSTSSAKLTRRQASPSPDRAFAFPPTAPLSRPSSHRRAASDLNLSREPSATNLLLKKNSSHTSLKRNRSKVEIIGKKSKSSTNLSSHGSASARHNHKHGKAVNQVHFNLGDEEDDDDNQEDEWVDASTSASPLLSRRTSVVSGGQQSAASSAGNSRPPTASEQPPQQPQTQAPPSPRPQSTRSTNGQDSPRSASTSQHNQYLTSRLLERTTAQGAAPPKMSTETASVQPSRAHSPDDSDNIPPPSPLARIRPGSSGNKPELTSRFITTTSSGGSGSGTGPDSFTGALARAANGRIEVVAAPEVRRPKSMGSLSAAVPGRGGEPTDEEAPQQQRSSTPRRRENGRVVTDNNAHDDDGSAAAAAADKKAAAYVMNRTQQKINLQRASSSLEPSSIPPHHPALLSSMAGLAGSPAVGAGGQVGGVLYGGGRGETVLPRLLERTGTEYLVVRRYQNPVARSLARLLAGQQDRRMLLRVPKGRTPAHSRQGSELRSGPVQSLREREGALGQSGDGVGLGLIGGRGERRPGSRRGNGNGVVNGSGNGDGGGESEGANGLSGSSLVDGGEEANVFAVLRNLWDKNMDLSASQD